ncbi:signal peptidase II [Leifsonia sp. NPDC014704]|uniref:Lipoprotein signal peptidase n=1 Tax=Leifsonia virtsii TaxID=3035915 RepID=A0ABT8J2K9_9MICO|nr:signal peptidase II [Leifsonia virtsii]MDN4599318.1 signal peptidase II [Leifsonia virtsii]
MTQPAHAPRRSRVDVVSGRARWLLVLITFVLGALVVALDQSTKELAEVMLTPGNRTPLIGDLFGLQLTYNPGGAFSLGAGATWIFTIVSVIAAIAAVVLAIRVRRARWAVVIGVVGGAATSHAADRLFRSPGFGRGYVVDFLAYGNWFIGNIADICIVVGLVVAALFALTSTRNNGKGPRDAADSV